LRSFLLFNKGGFILLVMPWGCKIGVNVKLALMQK